VRESVRKMSITDLKEAGAAAVASREELQAAASAVRPTSTEAAVAEAVPPSAAPVDSWFDAGVRLEATPEERAALVRAAYETQVAAEKAAKELATLRAARAGLWLADRLTPNAPIASDEEIAKDVGNAVGLLTGAGTVAALGLDVASLDADMLALTVGVGAAVVAEEDTGVVGSTFRTVGNVASPVIKVTSSVASKTAAFAKEKELGWKARALLEIGVESVVRQARGATKAPKPPPAPKAAPKPTPASPKAPANPFGAFKLPELPKLP